MVVAVVVVVVAAAAAGVAVEVKASPNAASASRIAAGNEASQRGGGSRPAEWRVRLKERAWSCSRRSSRENSRTCPTVNG